MKLKTLKWFISSIKNSHNNLRLTCSGWSVGEINPNVELTNVLIGSDGFLEEGNGWMSIQDFEIVLNEFSDEDLEKEVYIYK